MQRTYTLQELLDMGTTWQKVEHGVEVSFSDNGYSGFQTVTNEELSALHPHLVHVLSHWYKHLSNKMHIPWIHSHNVQATLNYWAEPYIIESSCNGPTAVCCIYDVVERDESTVTLSVEHYLLDKAGEITYVSSTDDMDLVVTAEDLDAQFPGWEARLAVAESLGEFETLALSYVFSPTPVAPKMPSQLPDSVI